MNKTNKIIALGALVVIIAVGVWAIANNNKKSPETTPTNSSQNSSQSANESSDTADDVGAVVTYNADGFSPATFSVKSGQKIKILNETDDTIEFASDPHPVHTANPEMNSEDIAPGQIKEVTVTKKGEWGFHNHYNPSKRGTLTVE